jgi:PKD repeat protein/DNA-directed RNA polymerase subunit RPC12/RpoP
MTAFYAENTVNTRASGIYDYNIFFDGDGVKGKHYTVIRTTSSMPGKIYVRFDADNDELYVETTNIRDLVIDCRSIAEEKTKEILGREYKDDKNYYKTYFVEEVEIFTVYVKADHDIGLTFEDVPYPSKVTVNGIKLIEGTGRNYTFEDGDIKFAKALEGESEVKIYFEDTSDKVTANFVTDKKGYYHLVNTNIEFDPSSSTGNIIDYIWDMGDGNYKEEMKPVHSYKDEGDYDVILVVRDGDGDIDRFTETLHIYDIDSDGLPDGWENEFIGNLNDDERDDPDDDGLDNSEEYRYNTDPRRRDTDNDGWSDLDEIEAGTDPTDRFDKPTEEEEDNGLFGLGKVGGIDVFLILLLFIIIIIIVIFAGIAKRKSKALEEEELEEEEYEEVEEEEELEEEEVYECPECGSEIGEDQPECDECGATLEWEEEELEEEMDAEEAIEEPGADLEAEAVEEEEPGALEGMEEEDAKGRAEEFECPTCGATVTDDDAVCPTCGEEFED